MKTALITLALVATLSSVGNFTAMYLFVKERTLSEDEMDRLIFGEKDDSYDVFKDISTPVTKPTKIGKYYKHPVKREKETCEELAICEEVFDEETCENIFKTRRAGKDELGTSFITITKEHQ